MEEKRNLKINFKQAQEMLKEDNEILKKLALEAFPEMEKYKYPNKYPMSYLELVNSSDNGPRTTSVNPTLYIDKLNRQLDDGIYFNSCLSKEQVKEIIAFIKLLALVKEWNEIDEFVPDWWDDNVTKSVITNWEEKVLCGNSVMQVTPFVFKDDKTAELFLDTFIDLLKQCKNII